MLTLGTWPQPTSKFQTWPSLGQTARGPWVSSAGRRPPGWHGRPWVESDPEEERNGTKCLALSRQHLSGGLQLRLQAIQNNVNHHSLRTLPGSAQSSASLMALRKWLRCTQFKMAQVEIQSSEAASQFYPL